MAMKQSVPTETEVALVEWINSFPDTIPITTLGELKDGQVFWRMLQVVEDYALTDNLPSNKQTEYARQQNLTFIYQRMQTCLEQNGRTYRVISDQELQQMACDETGAYAIEFLRIMLLIMLDSPRLAELVQNIQTLPGSTQQVVGVLMQEMVDWKDPSTSDEPAEIATVPRRVSQQDGSPEIDMSMRGELLKLEEQYATVMSQLERRNMEFRELEIEIQTLNYSLTRIHATNTALTGQIADREEQLKRQHSMNSSREQHSVRDLESKISQQEEAISSYESQISDLQNQHKELRREIKSLHTSSEKSQRLQDELDVVQIELEKQTRKANTADKYMFKLQSSQTIEKERNVLRDELDTLHKRLAELQSVRLENIALQKSNDEASRTLSQIEQEHEELRMTKRQMRISHDVLLQQVDALNERFAQDQETIAELRDVDNNSSAMKATTMTTDGLAGELAATSPQEDLLTQSFEQTRSNPNAANSAFTGATSLQISEQRLQEILKTNDQTLTQLRNAEQEVLALQTSLTAVQQGHTIEGTAVFTRMRDQLKSAEASAATFCDQNIALVAQIDAFKSDPSPIRNADVSNSKDDMAHPKKKQLDRSGLESKQDQALLDSDSESKVYITRLERELNLMASAFHDLSSRLSLNHVNLQRRSEVPRSWLGRQRVALQSPAGFAR